MALEPKSPSEMVQEPLLRPHPSAQGGSPPVEPRAADRPSYMENLALGSTATAAPLPPSALSRQQPSGERAAFPLLEFQPHELGAVGSMRYSIFLVQDPHEVRVPAPAAAGAGSLPPGNILVGDSRQPPRRCEHLALPWRSRLFQTLASQAAPGQMNWPVPPSVWWRNFPISSCPGTATTCRNPSPRSVHRYTVAY